MKTDESLVFDYLNPDFSILGIKKMAFVEIKPEQAFYLKHRVIHWLNKINNSIDPENNFETMRLERYLIGSSKTVVVAYGTRNTAGNLRFNYDGNNNFINFSFEENKKLYKNDEKFPKSSSLFEIDFKTDNKDEIVKYRISRSFDDYDGNGYNGNYIDDLKISYIFNVNGKREQEEFMVMRIQITSLLTMWKINKIQILRISSMNISILYREMLWYFLKCIHSFH